MKPKQISLTIYQPAMSANSFWGSGRGRRYIKPNSRVWRAHIRSHLDKEVSSGAMTPFSKEDRLEGKYTFNFKGSRKRDTANYEKPLTDTLASQFYKGEKEWQGLFEDDEQFDRWILERNYRAPYNSIEIVFTKIGSSINLTK